MLWTNWTAADTLRATLNGYNSINRNYQIGKTNILIPSYSLTTCTTIIIGDANLDNTINVVDIIMIVNYILDLAMLSNKQIVIIDVNHDGIINVIDIIQLVDSILDL